MSHEEIAGILHCAEEFSTQSWSLPFVPGHLVKHIEFGQAMEARSHRSRALALAKTSSAGIA